MNSSFSEDVLAELLIVNPKNGGSQYRTRRLCQMSSHRESLHFW